MRNRTGLVFLMGCLFFTGCDKDTKWDPAHTFTSIRPLPERPVPKVLNVMLMGQSNAAYMEPNGLAAFTANVSTGVVICKCASPGSYIRDWMPGVGYFAGCVAHMPHPDVVLWYQGEADAAPNGDYATWGDKFTQIVIGIRLQAGRNIPVVYAQLARDQTNDYPGFPLPGWMPIKDQQASLALANASMITTDDLPADGIHFTQAGYAMLGKRFAEALERLSL